MAERLCCGQCAPADRRSGIHQGNHRFRLCLRRKVVSKADPDERVGVLCLEDNKPSIVEYYEMTEEMRTLRNEDGSLAYRFGVILNYLFRIDALMHTLGSDFPLHIAHKRSLISTKQGSW